MPDTGPFFCRFWLTGDDAAEARAEIAADQVALAAARTAGDLVRACQAELGLGATLIPLGQEAAAVAHLEEALRLAREITDPEAEVEALLHLATAQQYLGQRALAQELFQRGLDISARAAISTHTHFLLHHRGRCYAEQDLPGPARDCFRQALALREDLGEPRFIASTRTALAGLPPAD